MDVRVRVNEGQQQRLVEKLNAMQEQQQYLFSGTMQRYVFEDDADPSNVTISLIWKDTEMPDESVIQQELSDFKQELADVLDWNTAQYRTKRPLFIREVGPHKIMIRPGPIYLITTSPQSTA